MEKAQRERELEAKRKSIIDEVARSNVPAIVNRLQGFQDELHRLEDLIGQQGQRIAHLEGRLNVEQQLRAALMNGSGPTG